MIGRRKRSMGGRVMLVIMKGKERKLEDLNDLHN